MVLELGKLVQSELSSERVEDMLALCDRINAQLGKMLSARPSKLQLQGLGLRFEGGGAARNGLFLNGDTPHADEFDESIPTTPRIDKGKGRAEPEPERHEPVLLGQRNFLVGESDDEGDQEFLDAEDTDGVASPTDR